MGRFILGVLGWVFLGDTLKKHLLAVFGDRSPKKFIYLTDVSPKTPFRCLGEVSPKTLFRCLGEVSPKTPYKNV